MTPVPEHLPDRLSLRVSNLTMCYPRKYSDFMNFSSTCGGRPRSSKVIKCTFESSFMLEDRGYEISSSWAREWFCVYAIVLILERSSESNMDYCSYSILALAKSAVSKFECDWYNSRGTRRLFIANYCQSSLADKRRLLDSERVAAYI